MKNVRFLVPLVLALSILLSACGQKPAAPASGGQGSAGGTAPAAGSGSSAPAQGGQQASTGTVKRISIATGGTSGVYYVYGGGLAQVLSKHVPGVEATAEVTSASVENLNLIAQKSADVAFTLGDSAYDAIKGKGKFKEALPIQALAVLYANYTHIVVKADSGINSVKDLAGRRVSTGSPNSGTEVIAERVLKAYGIDPQSGIKRERLGVGESADALKDGKIDAFFWSGGLPTAGVLELASTPGVKIRLLPTADVIDALVNEYGPLYTPVPVPPGVYPGVDQEVIVAGVPNLLVVHRDMPEDLAYNILKAMFDNKAELEAVHPEAKKLTLQTATKGSPVEFHPGAMKFYKEKGA